MSRTSFLLVLGLVGCAGMNQGATAEYSRQVTVVSTRVAQVEQSMTEAEDRLVQLEEVVRQRGRNEAEALENLDQVVAEINRLRGEIETMRFALDDIKKLQETALVDGERRHLHAEMRLRQVEEYLGVEAPPPPDVDGASDTGPTSDDPDVEGGDPDQSGDDPKAFKDQAVPEDAAGKLALALEHMDAGRPRVARAILEKAIEDHSGAPEMAELRYRFGETLLADGKWKKAIAAFQKVIDNHGKSDWASWAMYRQGECFAEMGQPENAKLFYEEVARLYPRSAAAKEAKRRLQ